MDWHSSSSTPFHGMAVEAACHWLAPGSTSCRTITFAAGQVVNNQGDTVVVQTHGKGDEVGSITCCIDDIWPPPPRILPGVARTGHHSHIGNERTPTPGSVVDCFCDGHWWPSVVLGAVTTEDDEQGPKIDNVQILEVGTLNQRTVAQDDLRLSLVWLPPAAGAAAAPAAWTAAGSWTYQTMPDVCSMVVAELRARTGAIADLDSLKQLQYKGTMRAGCAGGVENEGSSNSSSSFMTTTSQGSEHIPATPPGWPCDVWAAQVGQCSQGRTHLTILAAYIHDAATQRYTNFTREQWEHILAYLMLTDDDRARLRSLINSFAVKLASSAQEAAPRAVPMDAVGATGNHAASHADNTNKEAAGTTNVQRSPPNGRWLPGAAAMPFSSAVPHRTASMPASWQPQPWHHTRYNAPIPPPLRAQQQCQQPSAFTSEVEGGRPEALPLYMSHDEPAAAPAPAASPSASTSNVRTLLGRRNNSVEGDVQAKRVHQQPTSTAQPVTDDCIPINSFLRDAAAGSAGQKQASRQQPGSSTGTGTGAASGGDSVAKGCWVQRRLAEIELQRAGVTMSGPSGSYTFELQRQLGSGGEGSVWQVQVIAVQRMDTLGSAAGPAAATEASSTLGKAGFAGSMELAGHLSSSAGSSSSVSCVKIERQYALKVAGSMASGSPDMEEQEEFMQAEYSAMVAARSPHVVQVFDVGRLALPATGGLEASGGGEAAAQLRVPCMLMELSNVGSLASFVYATNCLPSHQQPRRRTGFTELQTKGIVLQVLEGLQAVHGCNIIHRDVKPANVLGFAPAGVDFLLEPDKVIWKLSDFGCSFAYAKGTNTFFNYPTTNVGTRGPGMAPEVAKTESADGLFHYSWPVDVWALAVLWLNVRFGIAPFLHVDNDPSRWCLEELRNPRCPYINPAFKIFFGGPMSEDELGFLECCLSKEPGERLSVDKLQLHPYFAT